MFKENIANPLFTGQMKNDIVNLNKILKCRAEYYREY